MRRLPSVLLRELEISDRIAASGGGTYLARMRVRYGARVVDVLFVEAPPVHAPPFGTMWAPWRASPLLAVLVAGVRRFVLEGHRGVVLSRTLVRFERGALTEVETERGRWRRRGGQ